MSRYIEVDMLRTVTDNFNYLHTGNYYYDCGFGDCVSRIESLMINYSTTDVAEVKHGEWITDKDGFVICSECGEEHTWDDFRPPFCDMCGARMDDGR